MRDLLKKYLKQEVVLDTLSSWIYIGVLEHVGDHHVELSQVDVHDNRDVSATKDRYVLDSVDSGIKANRSRVFINLQQVISFSRLEDVKRF